MRSIQTLFASLVALGGLGPAQAQQTFNLDPAEAHRRVAEGQLTLIDVRRPDEWAQTGLPHGAIGATLQDANFVTLVLAAVDGDTRAPVAVICRSGARSLTAQKKLKEAALSNVFNVTEGMSGSRGTGPGWLARGLAVTPSN